MRSAFCRTTDEIAIRGPCYRDFHSPISQFLIVLAVVIIQFSVCTLDYGFTRGKSLGDEGDPSSTGRPSNCRRLGATDTSIKLLAVTQLPAVGRFVANCRIVRWIRDF